MPVRKPTPKDIDKYRGVLLQLKAELSGDIDDLEADAFLTDGERASVDNPADIGSDSFAQEFSLELLQRDEQTLSEIIEALDRIDTGTFGKCEGCESWIRRDRLNAMPYARNCIECQRAAEQTR